MIEASSPEFNGSLTYILVDLAKNLYNQFIMKTRLEAEPQNSGGYPGKVTTSRSKILLKKWACNLIIKNNCSAVGLSRNLQN